MYLKGSEDIYIFKKSIGNYLNPIRIHAYLIQKKIKWLPLSMNASPLLHLSFLLDLLSIFRVNGKPETAVNMSILVLFLRKCCK